jgi:hypothetical protein
MPKKTNPHRPVLKKEIEGCLSITLPLLKIKAEGTVSPQTETETAEYSAVFDKIIEIQDEIQRFERIIPITVEEEDNKQRRLDKLHRQLAEIGGDETEIDAEKVDESTDATKTLAQKPEHTNFFTQEGDVWHIGFGGQTTRIKHLAGLLYIGHLLQTPETAYSCSKLYHAVNPPEKPTMTNGQAAEERLNINTKTRVVHKEQEKQAKKAIQYKLSELSGDFERAESELERKDIQDEMNMIIESLNSENKLSDPNNKKVQANIRKRLDCAYKAIGKKEGMKELKKHLQKNIKPDGKFGLYYTGSLTWGITLQK